VEPDGYVSTEWGTLYKMPTGEVFNVYFMRNATNAVTERQAMRLDGKASALDAATKALSYRVRSAQCGYGRL